jgi:hypothetical protein
VRTTFPIPILREKASVYLKVREVKEEVNKRRGK